MTACGAQQRRPTIWRFRCFTSIISVISVIGARRAVL